MLFGINHATDDLSCQAMTTFFCRQKRRIPVAELKDFLAELAINPKKLGEFIHDPEAAMTKAELSKEDKAALLSGFPSIIYARLAGVPTQQAFQITSSSPIGMQPNVTQIPPYYPIYIVLAPPSYMGQPPYMGPQAQQGPFPYLTPHFVWQPPPPYLTPHFVWQPTQPSGPQTGPPQAGGWR